MIEIWLSALIFFLFCIYNYYKNKELYAAAGKFPGPRALPILGNSLDFAKNSAGIFSKFVEFSRKYDRFFRVWNNGKLYVICYDCKDTGVLLGSNVHLRKNDSYQFLYPWIGEGLISSSAISSWRKHRKIITPTFHFKILHNFLEVFSRNAQILCDQLAPNVGKGPFNVHEFVKLLALDNICETAMGVNMNAQKNSESGYVRAVKDISRVVVLRIFKVWLMIDVLFNMSKYATIQKKALEILHETTNSLIRERREKLHQLKHDRIGNSDETQHKNKKLAFLDLLLESDEGSQLSDKEIREEVDTFMFAGHDTISSGLAFTLYCLAHNPEIQEMAYKEQEQIFQDSNRQPTYADIQEMKYLEQVVKEVERLYPSVPVIGRELFEDLQLPGNYVVPKGTQLCINIFSLHRDPKVWPNPEKFNPDNFLPAAILSRNPYSYVPFSAGPRNCIGQKYAMLAMKASISTVLRHYKILPSPYPQDKLNLAAELILMSTNGIHVQIEFRH